MVDWWFRRYMSQNAVDQCSLGQGTGANASSVSYNDVKHPLSTSTYFPYNCEQMISRLNGRLINKKFEFRFALRLIGNCRRYMDYRVTRYINKGLSNSFACNFSTRQMINKYRNLSYYTFGMLNPQLNSIIKHCTF